MQKTRMNVPSKPINVTKVNGGKNGKGEIIAATKAGGRTVPAACLVVQVEIWKPTKKKKQPRRKRLTADFQGFSCASAGISSRPLFCTFCHQTLPSLQQILPCEITLPRHPRPSQISSLATLTGTAAPFPPLLPNCPAKV